jgi:hypothetical protein
MPTDTDYAEFEIELRSVEKGFEARLLAAPFGRASTPFSPPLQADQLQDLLTALEGRVTTSALAARDTIPECAAKDEQPHPPPCDPAGLGTSLFDSLVSGPIATRFRESLAAIQSHSDHLKRRGLRVRLTFDRQEDFALLATPPWELLRDGQQFLALDRRTPIVRSHNQRTIPQLAPTGRLRVLLVESSPRDLTTLHTAEETKKIRAALATNTHIEVAHFEHPNVRTLRDRLNDDPCHVLHFMGHGDLLPGGSGDEFVLYFEGAEGQAEPVTGQLFAEYIKDVPELRLVVLNSCWGAALPRRQGQDPFTGVAAALMARDIPAVIAMQFPISDAAAIAFSNVFYSRLAAGDPVCAAVTEGRLEIMRGEHETLEWATPALFLAGSDRLFEIPASTKRRKGGQSITGARSSRGAGSSTANRPLLLSIRSFEDAFLATAEEPDDLLDLTSFFDGRHIRRRSLWRKEVFPRLRDFLLRHALPRRPLVFDFAAHSTLAFAAGYCLEAKSGLDITLLQRGQPHGVKRWRAEAGPAREGPLWIDEPDRRLDAGADDVALAVGVTLPVLDDVDFFIEKAALSIGRIIPATLHPRPGPSGVADGLHALQLAQELAWKIRGRSVRERSAVIHLFAAAPNALLFFLGQLGKSFGTVQLYEHAHGSAKPGAYQPSLRLPLPKTAKRGG